MPVSPVSPAHSRVGSPIQMLMLLCPSQRVALEFGVWTVGTKKTIFKLNHTYELFLRLPYDSCYDRIGMTVSLLLARTSIFIWCNSWAVPPAMAEVHTCSTAGLCSCASSNSESVAITCCVASWACVAPASLALPCSHAAEASQHPILAAATRASVPWLPA